VFVARFVGSSNVLKGPLARQLTGVERPFAVRPEHIHFVREVDSGRVSLEGKLVDVQFHGASSRYTVELADGALLAVSLPNTEDAGVALSPGEAVRLAWSRHAMVELEPEAGA